MKCQVIKQEKLTTFKLWAMFFHPKQTVGEVSKWEHCHRKIFQLHLKNPEMQCFTDNAMRSLIINARALQHTLRAWGHTYTSSCPTAIRAYAVAMSCLNSNSFHLLPRAFSLRSSPHSHTDFCWIHLPTICDEPEESEYYSWFIWVMPSAGMIDHSAFLSLFPTPKV